MARQLKVSTVLHSPESGEPRVFGPDDTDIPKWARDQMGDHLFDGPADDEEPPAPTAPAKSASKGDWVEWAVACGAEAGEADAMTKDELVERYGDVS